MGNKALNDTLKEAVKRLFENQPNIYDFTSATGQTEWNLAHHLAYEIWKYFPKLNCDLDVIKRNYGNKRPDIIFHKRGGDKNNFLVVEVKYESKEDDLKDDINKIKEFWFMGSLHYKYGAVIHLKDNKTGEVYLLQNK